MPRGDGGGSTGDSPRRSAPNPPAPAPADLTPPGPSPWALVAKPSQAEPAQGCAQYRRQAVEDEGAIAADALAFGSSLKRPREDLSICRQPQIDARVSRQVLRALWRRQARRSPPCAGQPRSSAARRPRSGTRCACPRVSLPRKVQAVANPNSAKALARGPKTSAAPWATLLPSRSTSASVRANTSHWRSRQESATIGQNSNTGSVENVDCLRRATGHRKDNGSENTCTQARRGISAY